jgi:pimeloyl-ACP methyl ester carboxylesterase
MFTAHSRGPRTDSEKTSIRAGGEVGLSRRSKVGRVRLTSVYVQLVRVKVDDVRLFFEVIGREYAIASDAGSLVRRPVVVGLHGGPGLDGTKLRFQLAQLADIAQIVVPDQRGHGRSDHGTPDTWNLGQWAADVKVFADALGIERPIVLGVSFGGFVAQRYASTYPGHPAALILISRGPRFARPDEIGAHPDAGAEVATAITRRSADAPEGTDEEEWTRLVRLSVRRDPDLDRLDALRIRTMAVNQHFDAEGFGMDLRPGLANVRCPTLVIAGERDVLVPAHLGQEIINALPPGLGRLEVVQWASHEVFTDAPTETWRLIRDFISHVS